LIGNGGSAMSVYDLSRRRVLLFGAFGNGNLGDMYQALGVRHHLLTIGMQDENIFACSVLDSHEYPFPERRKLPGSYLKKTADLNSQFSALLVGGGGLLAHPHDPLQDPRWARSVAIPVAFLSIGANDDYAKKSSELLDRALAITGRDGPSLKALRHSTARECFLLRDPLLCVTDTAPLLEFDLPTNADTEHAEPIDLLWILRSPVNDQEARLIKFVHDYIHSDDVRRHSIVVTEPALDAQLLQLMPGLQVHQPKNLRAFLHFIDRARFIFSMRYHGVIFATLAGKVAYGLSQKSKMECLYTECGLPGCYVNDIDQLARLIENRNAQHSAVNLAHSRNFIRIEFVDQMKVIEKAVFSLTPPRQQLQLEAAFERNLDAYYRAVIARCVATAQLNEDDCLLERAIDAGLLFARRETARIEDWVALAHLLAKANRLEEALAWISRAVAVSEVADYYRLQASVLERLGRFEEAVRAASQALKLRPNDNKLVADVERISATLSRSGCIASVAAIN